MNPENGRLRELSTAPRRQQYYYSQASKKFKTEIIDSLTKELNEQGIRFMSCIRSLGQEQYWHEAKKKKAREKISQELRDAGEKIES